jgi:hypothetical protein
MTTRTRLTVGLGILLLIGAGIQLIRPERVNPTVDPAWDLLAVTTAPEEIRTILRRSCYDCHSNQTRWPWYSEIAPASWLTAQDVRNGRGHLNFSEWGKYPRGRQISRLEMMGVELDKGSMPPGKYLLLHRDASLTREETEKLLSWVDTISDSLTSRQE